MVLELNTIKYKPISIQSQHIVAIIKDSDEHGNNIYNNIDMSEYMSSYTMINNDDNSIDICFYNNKIIRLNVKLIRNIDSGEEFVKLDV